MATTDGAFRAATFNFLRRLVRAIRGHWPRVEILIRADSHYCAPEVLDFCRAEGLDFILVFERIFERLSGEPDFEYALIDGTIVAAHHKASGAKGGLNIRPSAAHAAT